MINYLCQSTLSYHFPVPCLFSISYHFLFISGLPRNLADKCHKLSYFKAKWAQKFKIFTVRF